MTQITYVDSIKLTEAAPALRQGVTRAQATQHCRHPPKHENTTNLLGVIYLTQTLQ